MKNPLIISLLILSVGFSQKEYDINHVLEKKGVYIKKFSDEEVNGSAYQMFGDIKMDLGYIKNLFGFRKCLIQFSVAAAVSLTQVGRA